MNLVDTVPVIIVCGSFIVIFGNLILKYYQALRV